MAHANELGKTSDEDFNFNEEIVTQWGGRLTPSDDDWYLNGQTICFKKLSQFATEDYIKRLKIVLAYRAMRFAAVTIRNDFNRVDEFLRFLRECGVSDVDAFTEEHLIRWLSGLTELERKHQLGALRGVLLSSVIFLNKPLLEAGAVSYLSQLRLPGNPKGGRVNDLEQGRMTLAERDLFETRSRQAYEMGRIDAQEFLTLILFNAFGLRLVDYSSLKVKDVHVELSDSKILKASIDIPSGKSGGKPRSKISRGNAVDHDVAILLHDLITGRSADSPLFDIEGSEARTQTGVLEGHHTVITWSNYLQGIIYKLHLGFHLNSYRFRYTVGTEAYRETGKDNGALNVQGCHLSSYGMCNQNYISSGCRKFMECLDCDKLLCIKGVKLFEENAQKKAEELRARLKEYQQQIIEDVEDGIEGADQWLAKTKRQLAKLEGLINEFYMNKSIQNGSVVQLSPDPRHSSALAITLIDKLGLVMDSRNSASGQAMVIKGAGND